MPIEAKKTTELANLNRSTVNNIYHKLRERIAQLCEAESPFQNGEVELDESYFGARRGRGKRGRGAKGNYRNGSDIDLTLKGQNLTRSLLTTIQMELEDIG